jgi:hypothetical protein
MLRTTARVNVSWLGVQSNGEAGYGFLTVDGTKGDLQRHRHQPRRPADPAGRAKAYLRELGGSPGSDVPFVVEPKEFDFGIATIFMTTARRVIFHEHGAATDLGLDAGRKRDGRAVIHGERTPAAPASPSVTQCAITVSFRPTTVGPKAATLEGCDAGGDADRRHDGRRRSRRVLVIGAAR